MTKYIFITGGVVSSLGKGIAAASIASLLKNSGYKTTIQKFDPYLNVDPGTMNPIQHGEVFVTDDGCETDLDLGHYERFLDVNLSKKNNVTSGMIFWNVLTKERKGDYLGNTVQIVPHVTNEIKRRITLTADDNDFVITEIGGTIGDIESAPFLEAIRQFEKENKDICLHIHLTLIPYLSSSQEFKTKPTQHSVKQLREIGITADILICRSEQPIDENLKDKIAMFCDVDTDSVISAVDVDSIYDVPLNFANEKVIDIILRKFNLKNFLDLSVWKNFIYKKNITNGEVNIAIVGKYIDLHDAYISVVESLKHAAIHIGKNMNITWINSENENEVDKCHNVDGILVPGGFGDRGINGKIKAANIARTQKIPYLGLCLGLHIAIIEFARNVLNLSIANSTEFDAKTPFNVIDLLPEQKRIHQKGGTMRLGSFICHVKEDSLLEKAYSFDKRIVTIAAIEERHRHRYEFNNKFKTMFENAGLIISGTFLQQDLVEVIELPQNVHPWFLACQFHPEFKSRPYRPHPLFISFVKAANDKTI